MDVLVAHDACSSKDQTGYYPGGQSQLPVLRFGNAFVFIVIVGLAEDDL